MYRQQAKLEGCGGRGSRKSSHYPESRLWTRIKEAMETMADSTGAISGQYPVLSIADRRASISRETALLNEDCDIDRTASVQRGWAEASNEPRRFRVISKTPQDLSLEASSRSLLLMLRGIPIGTKSHLGIDVGKSCIALTAAHKDLRTGGLVLDSRRCQVMGQKGGKFWGWVRKRGTPAGLQGWRTFPWR